MTRTGRHGVTGLGAALLLLVAALMAFSSGASADTGAGYAPGWEPHSTALDSDIDPAELIARAEASDGDVSAATIFGVDNRIPIENTTDSPWRTIAHLYIGLSGGDTKLCTATFVAPNALVTAAHCLYDENYGGFPVGVAVVPGETAYDEPFGYATAASVSVPTGWSDTGSFYYDYGLIVLDGDPFAGALGPYFMRIGATPDSMFAEPEENVIATAGYPADKPLGSMWFTGSFQYSYDSDFLYTMMDAYPGQSGSAIFVMDFEGEELIDVYIGGIFSFETSSYNAARRLTQVIVDALVQWCSDSGCTINTQQYPDDPIPTPTATATPSPSPTATATPSPSPTATATATPSPTATATATPSPTATSTPTPPPSGDNLYTYDLHFRWSLIAWFGPDGIATEDAIKGEGAATGGQSVLNTITALYGWNPASQSWRGFFPEGIGVPGANDLETLEFGQAYWLAINDEAGRSWTISTEDD